MKLIDQTRFGGPAAPVSEQGNCLAAAAATILQLPLEEVEEYASGLRTSQELDNHWWQRFVEWCRPRGVVPLYFPWGSEERGPERYAWGSPGLLYIACGQSPRRLAHSVVYLDGKLFHDPHPSRAGLETVDAYILFAWTGPGIFVKETAGAL